MGENGNSAGDDTGNTSSAFSGETSRFQQKCTFNSVTCCPSHSSCSTVTRPSTRIKGSKPLSEPDRRVCEEAASGSLANFICDNLLSIICADKCTIERRLFHHACAEVRWILAGMEHWGAMHQHQDKRRKAMPGSGEDLDQVRRATIHQACDEI